jgi:NADH pyrophosphatase NudC (nudix superfamily)
MVGFVARALPPANQGTLIDQEIRIDPEELVEASWFTKSQVAAACRVAGATMSHDVVADVLRQQPHLPLLIPPKGVLARTLIERWLSS